MRAPRALTRLALPLAVAAAVTTISSTAAAAGAGPITGPDISSWNHWAGTTIDWAAVRRAGHSFVIIKATEGGHYRNPYFAADWAGARAAGLVHGAYAFARPNTRPGSAARQARLFVRTAGRADGPGDLPPTLDLEITGGLHPSQLVAWTRQWVTTVEDLTGRTPMIYSFRAFWRWSMAGTRAFRDSLLWTGNLTSRPTNFDGAWRTWTFWQTTITATIPGLPGPGRQDLSRFNGTMDQLLAIANPWGAPAQATPAEMRHGPVVTTGNQGPGPATAAGTTCDFLCGASLA